MNAKLHFLALWAGLLVPCAGSAHAARPAAEIAPLLVDLASPAVPLASRSALAQRYFAQGVVLVWGFNAAEAARSFDASIATDPRCALRHWALAWSLGPTLNADMADADAPRIRAALARARAAARGGNPRDRSLIEALRIRHPPAVR